MAGSPCHGVGAVKGEHDVKTLGDHAKTVVSGAVGRHGSRDRAQEPEETEDQEPRH
jgi:hypothetical protein